MDQDAPTILANTESVGNNVCTWVQTNSYGKTVRAKIYNKIVSNFEAGEVREPFGGHLADYADCSKYDQGMQHKNEHSRGTEFLLILYCKFIIVSKIRYFIYYTV